MVTTLANISIKDNSSWNTYLNLIYPVGSIYIAYTSTSPATRFGGTWSQISSRFLYCTDNIETGGSNTHTLSSGEMPSHNHSTNVRVQTSYPTGRVNGTNGWLIDATSAMVDTSYSGRGKLTTICPHTKVYIVGGELPRFSGVGDINAYSC